MARLLGQLAAGGRFQIDLPLVGGAGRQLEVHRAQPVAVLADQHDLAGGGDGDDVHPRAILGHPVLRDLAAVRQAHALQADREPLLAEHIVAGDDLPLRGIAGQGPVVVGRALHVSLLRASANTADSMGAVSRPVFVFCRLG